MGRPPYAVAAPNQCAAAAADACFAAGGNAVDAGVAALVMAACTEITITSPLGSAFITVWPEQGEPVTIDGNVAMPGLDPTLRGEGVREFTVAWGAGVSITAGHGSVAVPGMWAGLELAHQRWGALPWREVITVAAELLRQGYTLGKASATYLQVSADSVFGWHDATRTVVRTDAGVVARQGDTLTNPDLVNTLQCIADGGAKEVYTGEIAHAIVKEMRSGGGLLSADDLAAYRAEVRDPLRLRLGQWDTAVNPGPGVGGPVLAAMLTLAEQHWERSPHDDDVAWASTMLHIQHAVLSYRAEHLDRSDDFVVAGRELIALARGGGIDAVRHACTGKSVGASSPNTVQVSVVDGSGTACSITSSGGYGSGVTIPGTGLMANSTLGEPELNRRGLHSHPVGQRLSSNMAPTVARAQDGSVLAIGSPGADRITTALHSVLTGVCLRDQSLHDAIDAPRAHLTWKGDDAVVEFEDVPHLREAALASGWTLAPYPPLNMYFGGVTAALLAADGTPDAVADPRREAVARMSSGS